MRSEPARCVLVCLALFCTEGAAPAAPAEWPGFRGPDRDGKSPDTGLLKQWPEAGPKLLWKADSLGHGFSSPSVAGGMLYVSGIVGGALTIFAMDMDGKPQWKARHGPDWAIVPGSRSTPTLDGGNLYLLSGDGLLRCFDAKSGAAKWSKHARDFGGSPGQWGYAESVLIHNEWAIFKPGGRSCIVALDKKTGGVAWTSRGISAGPEYGSCLPLSYEGTPMILAGTSKGLVCVDARTGAFLWNRRFSPGDAANCLTPAYSDGHVFLANGYGRGGVCVKLAPGGKAAEAWNTPDARWHHGGYVIDKGHIYGSSDGGWVCLDLKTGRKVWGASGGQGSLCWADGMLYLFSEGGHALLATCSPDGLQITGRLRVQGKGRSWAHPVVIGGRLYLRYGAHLYCFDVRGRRSGEQGPPGESPRTGRQVCRPAPAARVRFDR